MALIQSTKDKHFLTFDDIKHSYTLDGRHVPGVTTAMKGGYPQSMQLTSWMIGQGAEYTYERLIEESTHEGNFVEWPSEATKKEIIKGARTASKKVAEEAAGIGTIVHDYAYLTELGKIEDATKLVADNVDSPNWESINNGIKKFTGWKEENKDEIVSSEAIVAHVCPMHEGKEDDTALCSCYGGKFDRLAKRGDLLVLSDFKTSSGIYVDMFIQLAAYTIAIDQWLGLKVDAVEILRFGKEDGELQTLMMKGQDIEKFKQQAIRCRETYEFRKMESDKRFKFGGKRD